MLVSVVLAACGADGNGTGGAGSTSGTTTSATAAHVDLDSDSAKVARHISNGIAQQLGVVLFVECPPDLPDEPGERFECTARSTDTQVLPIEATVQDEDENVEWKLDAISTTGIARTIAGEIKTRRNLEVSIDCPDVVAPAEGDEFECEARTAKGETYPVRATFTDDEGNVTWEVLGAGAAKGTSTAGTSKAEAEGSTSEDEG